MHHPNPFDFVPFAPAPTLMSPSEFAVMGRPMSGYLELTLKALAPLHIVGAQERGYPQGTSHFARQAGQPCVPASSIRGCLRSFIEALTSGWVSQTTERHPKDYNVRHVGFATFESEKNQSRRSVHYSPPAIDPTFKPTVSDAGKLDLASYLFGVVFAEKAARKVAHSALARKSKVWIEDAYLDDVALDTTRYWVPDLANKAFMGGGKARASNWWYMEPDEVWVRNVHGRNVAEFIGRKFRGRKFYYHQDPLTCVRYYDPDSHQWTYHPQRPFYRVGLEAMKPGAMTAPFRVYLDRVPQSLVVLLTKAFLPGPHLRHKLGYGKAYGYGSVEFMLKGAQLRFDDGTTRLPPPLSDSFEEVQGWERTGWEPESLANLGVDSQLIDREALNWLARILGWYPANKLLFTYPPFTPRFFKQAVQQHEYIRVAGTLPAKVTASTGRSIAKKISTIKRTIDFREYQESAQGWSLIAQRQP